MDCTDQGETGSQQGVPQDTMSALLEDPSYALEQSMKHGYDLLLEPVVYQAPQIHPLHS